ncbi:hypothetical protein V500_07865 [Pseudogymnoascus sp. VKM F-4518 (FW-2643)]|nr:hypothetical protein V500_07865 [Pseudogymnoascus sp. VKM F-4518 (FW-2643)]
MAGIYAIGSNGSGQLGIGHKEDVSVPKQVLFPDSSFNPSTNPGPVTIRAGGNHTLLLTSSGTLLSAGDSSQGARGLDSSPPSQPTHFSPVIFTSPSSTDATDPPLKITHCAAKWESSIVVAADSAGRARDIYTFGTGNKGELGLGELIFRSARPQLLPDFPPAGREVVDLAACVGHVVVVLDNGDVYGWGNGRKGQLGEPAGVVHSPRKIEGVGFKAVRAVCGREFTYLLSSPESGSSLFLGAEKWDVKPPPTADIRGWKDVGAGWGNIVVLKDDGEVVSWGRNDHGQCAPADLPVVDKIAVGSEHTLALTREGDVLAWGWGEHGNCGPGGTDVRVATNVVASSRYLPEGSGIAAVGGGCATSWVCVVGG